MKKEIHRELSNVYVGNQLLEETETIVYYSDGSFNIVPPETVSEDEEDE